LKLLVGQRVQHQREQGGGRGHGDAGQKGRPEQPQEAHAGRLEGDDLQVAGEPASGEQDGNQERHRQRVGQERGQHEHQELHDEVERHPLGDHELGQVVNAVQDKEEREQRDAERERRHQLAHDVAVEHRERQRFHGSVVT